MSSNFPKIGSYHIRRRRQYKKNTTSNHLGNEGNVNDINQCKYGSQYENCDHLGYYQDHNQLANPQYTMLRN